MKKNMYEATNINKKGHFKVVDLTIDADGSPNPYGGGAFGLPPLTGKSVGTAKTK